MAIHEKLYTVDTFWDLCQEMDSDSRFELIEGVIHEIPPSSAIPAIVALKIGKFLDNYVEKHRLGFVAGADAGFVMNENTVLSPDVAYISAERLKELPERFFPIPPDLAVEVVSPTDSIKVVQRKAVQYLEHGTSVVWIVYPAEKSVDVCTLANDGGLLIHEVQADGILDGRNLLPNLQIALVDIFPSM